MGFPLVTELSLKKRQFRLSEGKKLLQSGSNKGPETLVNAFRCAALTGCQYR